MSEASKLLIATITDSDPAVRDRSVRELVSGWRVADKIEACAALEQFRRTQQNLYERVRASLFLHALYRYEIQDDSAMRGAGFIPFSGFMDLMERRYEPAIASFLEYRILKFLSGQNDAFSAPRSSHKGNQFSAPQFHGGAS